MPWARLILETGHAARRPEPRARPACERGARGTRAACASRWRRWLAGPARRRRPRTRGRRGAEPAAVLRASFGAGRSCVRGGVRAIAPPLLPLQRGEPTRSSGSLARRALLGRRATQPVPGRWRAVSEAAGPGRAVRRHRRGPGGPDRRVRAGAGSVSARSCSRRSGIVGGLARTEKLQGLPLRHGRPPLLHQGRRGQEDLARGARRPSSSAGPRLSRIYYNGTFFNYPLKPLNALRGLGVVAERAASCSATCAGSSFRTRGRTPSSSG